MPPVKRSTTKPALPKKPEAKPAKPAKPATPSAPSVDITRLLANKKTQALGEKLMMVDIEKGNANGRLDYIELPRLDSKTRATVAGLMTNTMTNTVIDAPPLPSAPAPQLVPAEKPGPLKREAARYRRFEYSDQDLLNEKGLPGVAFERKLHELAYNPFTTSQNNHADPAMLRAQARFLELTASGDLRPKTRSQRNELLRDLKQRMTVTGLDAMELAYFPAEKALAIVKRAAAAAKVDPNQVLITLNGNQVRLPAWERQLGDLTAVPIRPYSPARVPVTEAQRRINDAQAKDLAAEIRRQDIFFAQNPGASWSQYTSHAESLRNSADSQFWGAMEKMLQRAEVASWLPGGYVTE